MSRCWILSADVARDSRCEVRVEYALDVDSACMDDPTDIRCSGIENLHLVHQVVVGGRYGRWT
jgi:hypothetical protein